MTRYINLIGKQFGMLSVVSLAGKNKDRRMLWRCVCECGNSSTATSSNLMSGGTKSCGCLKHQTRNVKHGGKGTRLYRIWTGMKTRCLNQKDKAFKRYGGRGISITPDWMDYKNFHDWAIQSGYKNNMTIERLNNNGNYEPNNCTWILKGDQASNRRNTILVEYHNKTKTLSEWSKITGIAYPTIWARLIGRKWTVPKTLTTPILKHKTLTIGE